ncbi:MAG: hypothetical protein JW862_07510 [Anaerolineales bacterium]|nr:hypothetical protein [Anaerolineales bacterium]
MTGLLQSRAFFSARVVWLALFLNVLQQFRGIGDGHGLPILHILDLAAPLGAARPFLPHP